jgi:hypothetical protein
VVLAEPLPPVPISDELPLAMPDELLPLMPDEPEEAVFNFG